VEAGPLNEGVDKLPLSPREEEVAKAWLRGLKVAAVAHLLSISTGTVQTHIKRIYRKTGCSSRWELAEAARRAL